MLSRDDLSSIGCLLRLLVVEDFDLISELQLLICNIGRWYLVTHVWVVKYPSTTGIVSLSHIVNVISVHTSEVAIVLPNGGMMSMHSALATTYSAELCPSVVPTLGDEAL